MNWTEYKSELLDKSLERNINLLSQIEILESRLASAEQRAEQAEADKKHLYELIAEQGKKIQEYESNPCIPANIALLAELEQLRNIHNTAEKLMKNICAYCPPWYREDISKCAKWCGMRTKYELRQALAQAERGQE